MVIVIEEKISETKDYALHKGTRDSSPVCVYVVKLSEATYEAAKTAIVARDQASDSYWNVLDMTHMTPSVFHSCNFTATCEYGLGRTLAKSIMCLKHSVNLP